MNWLFLPDLRTAVLDSDSPCQTKKSSFDLLHFDEWCSKHQQTVYPAIYHLSTNDVWPGQSSPKNAFKTALCLGYPVDVQWFSRDFHINNSFLQPPMAHGRLARRRQFSVARRGESATAGKNRDGRGSRGRGVWVSGRGGQSDGHHHQLLVLQQGLLPWRWTYLVLRWEVGKKKHGCFEILLNLSGNHLSGWFDSVEKETERGALVKNKVKVFEEAEANARLFMQRHRLNWLNWILNWLNWLNKTPTQ